MQRPQVLGWVLGSSLLAAACARAAEPPPSTQYSVPPHGTVTEDVGQLERDLDQNEQVFLARLGQAAPGGSPTGTRKAEQEAAAPSAAGAVNTDEKAPSRSEPRAAPQASAPCADACRAFASMQRSAGRICELTSNDHERCTRARGRVRAAEMRLAQAGCVCAPQSD